MNSLNHFLSSLTLADLDVDAVTATSSAVVSVPTDPMAAADAAATAAADNGWFGFLTLPIEALLKLIHTLLTSVGMSADAWGVSIIAMTVVIKAATFPLTKSQLESTNKMQVRSMMYMLPQLLPKQNYCLFMSITSTRTKALQPTVKAIQAKYQSNPEVMNQKIAEVYQQNEINPLAGCIPSLVQIPVFIGLYRAVLNLAKDNALDEPFLFLPNLEGPTYGADPAHGSDWLFKNW